jgi:hypothetical protein
MTRASRIANAQAGVTCGHLRAAATLTPRRKTVRRELGTESRTLGHPTPQVNMVTVSAGVLSAPAPSQEVPLL